MKKRAKKTVVSVIGLILAASSFSEFTTNRIYEAENAEEMVGVISNSRAPDWLGTGYADFVGLEGSSMKWTRVFSDKGDATLTFRYSSGSKGGNNRVTDLYVNGDLITLFEWPRTDSWEVWSNNTIQVTLRRGINTVELRQKTDVGPNIDQLTVTSRPIELKTVPNVTGLSWSDAKAIISSAGLVVGTITTEWSSTVEEGVIMNQSEKADSSVPVDTPVDIVVSLGSLTVG